MKDWLASIETGVSGSAPFLDLGDGRTMRYAELWAGAHSVAERLVRVGLQPGDIVATALPNGPAFVTVLLGGLLAQAVVAPLDPLLTTREQQVALDVLKPRLLVTRPATVAECDTLRAVGTVDDVLEPRATIEWAERDPRHEPVWGSGPHPLPGDALILSTSGSTGRPKGVLLSGANLVLGVAAVVDAYRLVGDDRSPAWLPWTHGHGLVGQLLATMSVGASLQVDPGNRAGPAAMLAGGGHTWMTAVPPHLTLLSESLTPALAERVRLRFVRSASAPLRSELGRRIEDLLGCPVSEAYGMTETCHQAAANPPTFSGRRLGTVGRPTGVQARVAGALMDAAGEVEVCGPAVFRGYLGAEDESRAAFTPDGWYRTQDIGRIDPDGYLTLVGRRSEIINRGGFKIAPAEVEQAIARHPGVVECLVAGVPHPVLGQEVGALVVVRPAGPTVVDLRRHCRTELAAHKQPGIVMIVETVPRLTNGKPSRQRAAAILQSISVCH